MPSLVAARERIRKSIIRQAQKRQRPGSGSSRAFLEGRTAAVRWPDLTQVLAPISWAVVGAAATRLYMPERATADLDVAVAGDYATKVRRRLEAAGFRYQGELSIGGSTWRTPDGVAIDVLELRDSWATQALEQAHDNRDVQGLPVMPLPYLVLMKFQAGRVQDIADVVRILGQARDDQLNAVRTLFAEFLPGDREDLESLICLGKLELARQVD